MSKPEDRTDTPVAGAVTPDMGRDAIWKVVHEVWQLLDDGETDSAGTTTVDQDRLRAVSDAMDALEALVPDSVGPFWGGFPVNYFWKLAGQSTADRSQPSEALAGALVAVESHLRLPALGPFPDNEALAAIVAAARDNFALSQKGGVGARYGVCQPGTGTAGVEAWFSKRSEAFEYADRWAPVQDVWDLVLGQKISR